MMVVFEKGFPLRHIGHLDLMRTMQRAIRRSGLPAQYSQGFHPHILMSFASPLGVGVAGHGEVMDIPMAQAVSEEEFTARLNGVLPQRLRVRRCRLLEDTFPTLMALVAASRYTLRLDKTDASRNLLEALPKFMALTEYTALRKTKSGEAPCNIRPFVLEMTGEETGEDVRIHCVLSSTPAGTLKPSLLMKCLGDTAGVSAGEFIAIREEILCRSGGGLVPMEEYQYGG